MGDVRVVPVFFRYAHRVDQLDQRSEFLLASALIHAPRPLGQPTANCYRVIRHAMIAAGMWDRDLEARKSLAFGGLPGGSLLILEWYAALIALTRQRPVRKRLLHGAGDLYTPAGARYTACWLTPRGKVVAEHLFAQHPDLRERLTVDSFDESPAA